jgi:sugar phosphate isomerase/epimerase
MELKLGLQLYSLREQLSLNFEKTLEEVSLAGYEGVEFARLPYPKPERVSLLLQNLNLKPVAIHCDVVTDAGLKQSLDDAEALKCDNLICPWVAPDTFNSEKSIGLFSEKLNKANQQIKARGKNLFYHNHEFEFQRLNGKRGYDFFASQLDADIWFELDAYLVAVGGANPIEILHNYADRIRMLHIKDGAISPSNPNTAIGDGTMNYPTIISSLAPSVNWLFVEIVNCKSDRMEAVRKSARNLANITN